jgi:outer membrane protein assembly factor BamD
MQKIFFILVLFLSSCSQNNNIDKSTKISGDNIEQQMISSYKDGLLALEQGDVLFAVKKFNEAELLFPQSEWAPKSSLMAAYSYWSENYYNDSIEELKRYLKLYPKDNNLDYAYYLLAINYYDSIINEKKDLKPLSESKKYFEILVLNYPNTDYALDAKYKLELINDALAAKEIYIARHYINKKKWIAAINRLKIIIDQYNTTIYIEEALHRIVEIYYTIGLEQEAEKFAKILGYNYQSSLWYKKSYKVLNKNYEELKKNNKPKEKNKILEKIKSMF